MKSMRSTLSLAAAVALMAISSLAGVKPAAAQSIFASPRAAAAAHVQFHGNTENSNAQTAADSAPSDTTTPADPYAAIFGQVQTAVTGLLAGPGALAFGVLILALGFGVAWRLTNKGVKSIAK